MIHLQQATMEPLDHVNVTPSLQKTIHKYIRKFLSHLCNNF